MILEAMMSTGTEVYQQGNYNCELILNNLRFADDIDLVVKLPGFEMRRLERSWSNRRIS